MHTVVYCLFVWCFQIISMNKICKCKGFQVNEKTANSFYCLVKAEYDYWGECLLVICRITSSSFLNFATSNSTLSRTVLHVTSYLERFFNSSHRCLPSWKGLWAIELSRSLTSLFVSKRKTARGERINKTFVLSDNCDSGRTDLLTSWPSASSEVAMMAKCHSFWSCRKK